MALTITNTNTLSLLNILNRTSLAQASSMERLSTGYRINHGKDDPAGLLAINGLDSALTGVNAALSSSQRTDAILDVAGSSLGEVSSLLDEIQSLAASSASSGSMTPSELAANQSQIDDAIASIERIIRTTEFNGQKLLDGSMGIDVTGAHASALTDISVFNRNPSAGEQSVLVNVVTGATRAYTSGTAQALMTTSADVDTTLTIKGSLGTQVIEIAKDENLSSVLAKINDVTALTGVVASQTSDTEALHLRSQGYGSSEFVKVGILEGGTTYDSNDFHEVDRTGTDAVVRINGRNAVADGKEVYYNANGLSFSFKLTDGANAAGTSTSFTIDDQSGATFQLGTDAASRVTIGISGLLAQELGTGQSGEVLSALKSGGAYDLQTDPSKAAEIAAAAGRAVATLQGRLGGFQKYQVQPASNTLSAMQESLTAARSTIADVDYAAETAELNRQSVLMQAAISLLGLSSQQSAQILSLLR